MHASLCRHVRHHILLRHASHTSTTCITYFYGIHHILLRHASRTSTAYITYFYDMHHVLLRHASRTSTTCITYLYGKLSATTRIMRCGSDERMQAREPGNRTTAKTPRDEFTHRHARKLAGMRAHTPWLGSRIQPSPSQLIATSSAHGRS